MATAPPSKAMRGEGDADVGRAKEEGRRARSNGRTAHGPSDSLPVLSYKEGEQLAFGKYFNAATGQGRAVQVVIPAEALSNTNRQVSGRHLWGCDVYTADSDLVAILMHAGYYSHVLAAPPAGVAQAQVVVSTLPLASSYASKCRNNIRSRNWHGAADGCSIRVDACWLKTAAGLLELQAAAEGVPAISPSFMPAATERVMHTRSATASNDRRHRVKQEVSIQYNLCNEPWLKYTMGAVADAGLQPCQWTSARLHAEVLYLETARTRYEIARTEAQVTAPPDADGESTLEDTYRWSRCLQPLSLAAMRKSGVPCPEPGLAVLEPSLVWEDFQWSPSGVYVKGKLHELVRVHFMRITQPATDKEKA